MVCTVLDFSEPNRTAKTKFGTGTEPNRPKIFWNRTEPNRQNNFWNRNRTEPNRQQNFETEIGPNRQKINILAQKSIFSPFLCRKSPKICSLTELNGNYQIHFWNRNRTEPSKNFLEPNRTEPPKNYLEPEPNRTAKKICGTARTEPPVRFATVRFGSKPDRAHH